MLDGRTLAEALNDIADSLVEDGRTIDAEYVRLALAVVERVEAEVEVSIKH